MSKARDAINEVVKRGLAPALKAQGFKKNATHFARRQGAVMHYLNVQSSQWNYGSEGGFYINAGVAFDELCVIDGKAPPVFPKYFDCQFMVRLEQLDTTLPAQFRVDDTTDLDAMAAHLASRVLVSFVEPLNGVDSLKSFGKTGWIQHIPWGFPALIHYHTGDVETARRLVQLEADRFADRGVTFEGVAQRLKLSFD